MSETSQSIFVSKETQKRLLKDVADIMKNSLTKEGIYYIHDEENIMKGYAFIVGPDDTPYENGIFLFNFDFPVNYPYSPPKLTYLTNDGHTRFNPNLYRSGKVCLSILNTWKGEQWTSCQTIRSVLLTLVTVLNDTPLLNEPGISKLHKDFSKYNDFIKYKKYEVAIKSILNKSLLRGKHISFYPIIKKYFKKNYKKVLENIKTDQENYKKRDEKRLSTCIYNMNCTPNYDNLIKSLEILFNKLKK